MAKIKNISLKSAHTKHVYTVVIILFAIFLGTALSRHTKQRTEQANNNQVETAKASPDLSLFSPTPLQLDKTFTYNLFSISFPNDWQLSEMDKSKQFPLKSRFEPLYAGGKVIALSKGTLYMIITREEYIEGTAAEGIFVTDEDFQRFLAENTGFMIGSDIFYLRNTYRSIDSMENSESGPWMWSSVSEYLPNYKTSHGQSFKGSSAIIKRNGNVYNVIITAKKDGQLDETQKNEIINILQSIKW